MTRHIYRVWANSKYDCFNEQTFATAEEAIAEAERLWKYESYEDVHVSSEEDLDEDGYPTDHDVIWQNGKAIEE